jgi:hypothetical protein
MKRFPKVGNGTISSRYWNGPADIPFRTRICSNSARSAWYSAVREKNKQHTRQKTVKELNTMKTTALIFPLISILMLASCASLQSPYVIGEATTYSEDEIGNETVWKIDDEIYYARIISTNTVAVSVVKWDQEAQSNSVETVDLIRSELDGHGFVNFKEADAYFISRVAPFGDNTLVFYPVDNDALEKLIASDHIEQGEKKGAYILKGTKVEIDQFVSEHVEHIFNTDTPVVAELISGKLK